MDSLESLKKVSAVFSDIDGTLLNSESRLSDKTILSVGKLQIPFFLASGRFYRMMLPLAKRLDIKTPLVSASGALTIDQNGTIIKEYQIDSDVLKEIIADLNHGYMDKVSLHLYDAKRWFCNSVSTPLFQMEYRVVRCLPDVIDKDMMSASSYHISKFLIHAEPSTCDELYARWKDRYQDKIHLYHDKPTMIEIFDKDADKGKGVKELCRLYHFDPKEVTCIGDTILDESMLLSCGYPIAMGNASDSLKKIARFVAPTTDEDGLSFILDQITGR